MTTHTGPLHVRTIDTDTTVMSIEGTGAATFSSTVNISGTVQIGGNGEIVCQTIKASSPFYIKSETGILAKFQDNGTATNYPIFTAVGSGPLSIASAVTNSSIDITPNGTGAVRLIKQLQVGGGDTTTHSGAVTPGLFVQRNHTGTITGTQPRYNSISISTDTADSSGAVNPTAMLGIVGTFGGTGFGGGRVGLLVEMVAQGDNSNLKNIHGGDFWLQAKSNCGGTNLTNDAQGFFWGIYPQVVAYDGATFLNTVSGGEIDIAVASGASTKFKTGIQIVQLVGDAVQGAAGDTALQISNQQAAAQGGAYPIGWKNGIAFGAAPAMWPIHPTNGSIIGTQKSLTDNNNTAFGGQACKNGINFPDIEPTDYSLKIPAFWVDKNGVTKIGPATITPATAGATIDCDGQYVSAIASIANGGSAAIINDHVYDDLGGVYNVSTVNTAAGNSITALTIVSKAYSASPPSNPVALSGGHGSNHSVNLTWTASPHLSLNKSGDTIVGKQVALSAAATTGFLLVPFISAPPTGVPTNASLGVSLVYESSANRLWGYTNAWKSIVLI